MRNVAKLEVSFQSNKSSGRVKETWVNFLRCSRRWLLALDKSSRKLVTDCDAPNYDTKLIVKSIMVNDLGLPQAQAETAVSGSTD